MLKRKLKKTEMNKVFLGLGTNVGDRKNNLKRTVAKFSKNKDFTNIKISPVYETIPYGEIEQENFFNAVLFLETHYSLDELFVFTKNLEKEIGRKKTKTWGPRVIDIDILLYNDLIYKDKKINIPHKDLLNRDFVLVPLLDIDKEIVHPVEKKEIKQFLSKLTDQYIVKKISMVFN